MVRNSWARQQTVGQLLDGVQVLLGVVLWVRLLAVLGLVLGQLEALPAAASHIERASNHREIGLTGRKRLRALSRTSVFPWHRRPVVHRALLAHPTRSALSSATASAASPRPVATRLRTPSKL